MQLIVNIFRVVFSNLITLISNVVLGIILPMILSVQDYGEYRLFIFYISFIGLLHFGFIDAIYIKYGGFGEKDISKQLFKKEHHVFFVYQILISLIILGCSFLIDNLIFILLAISIIPVNLGAFHKLFYQATGQFKKYSYANILYTILNLCLICFLITIDINKSIYYIIFTLISYFILLIIMEVDFKKYTKGIVPKGTVKILDYNKVGIFILLGNLCILMINSIGRWIVQFFFDIQSFAYYSFSVSMMNMILLIINAIGLTFYNYIAKREDRSNLILIKKILLIIGVLAGSTYFILDKVVNTLLPDYVLSLNIIAISFVTFPYIMVINVIIINLYKARKREREFFKVVFSIFLLAIFINMLAFLLIKSMNMLALATLITFILWYVYSTNKEFKYLKGNKKEVIFLICHALIFFLCLNYLGWLAGFVTYLFFTSIISLFIYKHEFELLYGKFKKGN